MSRSLIKLSEQERSGKTSLKRSLKGQVYSSNEESSDGIIRVVPSHFKVATRLWNTGQEEQGVGSDSADLYHDSVAQKVAGHSRGDKAEQRTFERSVGNSSFSEHSASLRKDIRVLEQVLPRFPIMHIGQERSGKTSLKRSSKKRVYSSNEESSDGIIRVVPSHFKVATRLWNTGQEEQGVGSDSADLYHDSVAQKVAGQSRGDKAEQRTFERSVGNSSFAEHSASLRKDIRVLEQVLARFPIMRIGQERSGKTSLKRSSKGQVYSSNEESTDGIIRVVPSHFRVATRIWNTGQEEQGVGSDSADLYHDSVAQKVAGQSRGDKAEQRTFERNVGISSFSECYADLRKDIRVLEQKLSRLPTMSIGQERSGKTSLKRSLKGQVYSSNEESSDGIIRVVYSQFRVAAGIWNTGQEEQGVGSYSADLYYDSVAQKVADHLRGDKAEQRTFERSVGNSSSSNTAAVRGPKSHDDVDDDVQLQTNTPADQGKGATVNQEYPPVTYLLLLIFISVNFCFSLFFFFLFFWGGGGGGYRNVC